MVAETRMELYSMETEARTLGATLTAALLSRLDLPADREEAADFAVALFWRVVRGLVSEAPEQARPTTHQFRIEEKQQP